ncbi:MAG: DKNYY domain-containing protein [Sediminibacterium sp.]
MSWIALFFTGLVTSIGTFLGIHSPVPVANDLIVQVASSTESIKPKVKDVTPVNKPPRIPWVTPGLSNPYLSVRDGKVYVKEEGEFTEVVGADAVTFLVSDDSVTSKLNNDYLIYKYAKDKNTVYFRTRTTGALIPLSGIDVNTFVVVNGGDIYDSQDKNHKYFEAGVICEDLTKKMCYLYEGPGGGYGHWYQNLETP